MIYINEEAGVRFSVSLPAPRAVAVLEAMGYRSETAIARAAKKEDGARRIKAWVAANCCPECKRTQVFCICSTAAEKVDRTAGPSRKEMMAEAKARGIAYFRVMKKDELAAALKAGAEDLRAIQEAAKVRWKKGWSKR